MFYKCFFIDIWFISIFIEFFFYCFVLCWYSEGLVKDEDKCWLLFVCNLWILSYYWYIFYVFLIINNIYFCIENFKILNFKLFSYEKNYYEVMNINNFDVYCRFFVVLLWVLKWNYLKGKWMIFLFVNYVKKCFWIWCFVFVNICFVIIVWWSVYNMKSWNIV